LFDRSFAPPTRPGRAPAGAEVARAAAAAAIVLLQNDGVLPLRPDVRTIAVIGANADDDRALLGNYAYLNHVAYRFPGAADAAKLPTIAAAIRDRAGTDATVVTHPGVPLTD